MMDRRNKMVSFRLSLEEYERYRHTCASAGVRSLSELARAAMQRMAGEESGRIPQEDQLRYLREEVSRLASAVQRIEHKLEIEEGGVEMELALETTV